MAPDSEKCSFIKVVSCEFLLLYAPIIHGQFVNGISGGFLKLCTNVRVHGSQVGAGSFDKWVTIGADCLWYDGSSQISYSYLGLAPCLWNNGGTLLYSNSTDSCGGDFAASCTNCSLSNEDSDQINLTCSCNTGGAGSSTLTTRVELSMVPFNLYRVETNVKDR
ncbi:hypothetical protein QBC46DRAFT_410356 [Diplogelasinospora grovesii]|uniref:Cyanovirin-N domain-containing protein n=1 Tax=Diplogelasinospora grovesii TaxID=303347 RepID=A0AAN6N4J7_9PEZI|nr:hypothetical protein QBC46DRAFT_410356 [Diplogelasinospora grovesii]